MTRWWVRRAGRERLLANLAEAGAGTVLAWFQLADIPHSQVMPYLPRDAVRTAF